MFFSENNMLSKPHFDWPLLVTSYLLALYGVLAITIANFNPSLGSDRSLQDLIMDANNGRLQLMWVVVSMVVVAIIMSINYNIIGRLWPVIYFVDVLLLGLVLTTSKINGVSGWFQFLDRTFQPSELAKIAIIMTFSALISTYRDKMRTFRYGILPFAVIMVVLCGLVALERHFSCILIMLLLAAAMLFLGGVQLKWFALGGIAVGLFAFIYLKTQGYAGSRITAWRDPASDPTDNGYQILQSLYAIGSGGLMGLGLGKSRQKYLYLPEEHNDYIFPILCEELGFVGAVVVILLFILLIVRGYYIAMHARDRFGALLAAGISTHFALQTFLNIGVVTNFLPATGISLPFFSYGGTALLMQLFEAGIVLAVSRQCDNKLL